MKNKKEHKEPKNIASLLVDPPNFSHIRTYTISRVSARHLACQLCNTKSYIKTIGNNIIIYSYKSNHIVGKLYPTGTTENTYNNKGLKE